MKKTKTLLFLAPLLLLPSCSGGLPEESSSEEPASSSFGASSSLPSSESEGGSSESESGIGEILLSLKKGFRLETEAVEAIKVLGGNESETVYSSCQDFYSSPSRYRQIAYQQDSGGKQPSKESLRFDETYVESQGSLALLSLSRNNEVEQTPIKSKKGNDVPWASAGLENPFASLKEEDFESVDGGYRYSASHFAFESKIKSFFAGYGGSIGSFASLSLKKEGDLIALSLAFEPYTATLLGTVGASVTKSYTGTFQSFGEEVPLPTPIQKEEDGDFSSAMADLRALNFKTHVKNEVKKYKDGRFSDSGETDATACPDSFSYTIQNGGKVTDDAAYILDASGDSQRLVHYGGSSYYASGEASKAKIEDYWPDFKISSAFFNKEGNVYTLDRQYAGMFPNTSLFTPFLSDTIGNLTITLEEGKVTIQNVNDGYGTSSNFGNRHTIEYSSFGSASSFDKSKALYDCSSLPWKQMIRDEEAYSEFSKSLGGSSAISLIPVFGGVYSEPKLIENGVYYLYVSLPSEEKSRSFVDSYSAKLLASGFQKASSSGEVTYQKAIDGQKTLVLDVYSFQDGASYDAGILIGVNENA